MLVTMLSRLSLGTVLEDEELRLQEATLLIQAAERGRSARLALHSERSSQRRRADADGDLPTGAVLVATDATGQSARMVKSVRMLLRGRGSRRRAENGRAAAVVRKQKP